MEKLRRSWRLFKLSLAVTSKDRELIWLQVISLIFALVIAGIAAIIGLAADASKTVWVILFVIAALIYGIVSNFFRAAQMLGAKERLDGGDPTVSSSIGHAMGSLAYIAGWAILTTSVQLVLAGIRALARDRGGGAGLAVVIVTRLVGFAWEVITFLALPIVAVERIGPFKALKRSKDLLKNTWGENLAAQLGFGIFGFLFLLPGAAVGVLVGIFLHWGGWIFLGVWAVLVTLLMSTISAIYQMALYLYATKGKEPEAFAGINFSEAFKTRKSKKSKRQSGLT